MFQSITNFFCHNFRPETINVANLAKYLRKNRTNSFNYHTKHSLNLLTSSNSRYLLLFIFLKDKKSFFRIHLFLQLFVRLLILLAVY